VEVEADLAKSPEVTETAGDPHVSFSLVLVKALVPSKVMITVRVLVLVPLAPIEKEFRFVTPETLTLAKAARVEQVEFPHVTSEQFVAEPPELTRETETFWGLLTKVTVLVFGLKANDGPE